MSKTITRILGQKGKPKHLLGVYEIPDEAVWLISDIATLEIMQVMLDRLQERSFVERNSADYAERKDAAWKVLRRLAFIIALLKELAEANLTHDYLLGKLPKRPRRQTIADVLELLQDGFKP